MPRLVDASQQLTDQRTNRLFVGSFTGQLAATDQSPAGADNGIGNPTGQYQVRGPYGYAVEGQPRSDGQRVAVQRRGVSKWVYVAGAIVAIYFLRK